MTVSSIAWIALIGAIAVMLVIDLLVVGRRGGEMSLRFASLASVVWVAIALSFGGLLALLGETRRRRRLHRGLPRREVALARQRLRLPARLHAPSASRRPSATGC